MTKKFPPISLIAGLGDPKRFTTLDELIEYLEKATADFHVVEDHEFEGKPDAPGVCVCGWIHPDQPSNCECGHTIREHALKLLAHYKALRDGPRLVIDIIMIPMDDNDHPEAMFN